MGNEMTDTGRVMAELEIRNLVARYCHAYDQGRVDEYCELFVEDASFQVPPDITADGADQIREKIAAGAVGAPPAQHVTYNTVIDVGDDGSAKGWSDFMYVAAGPENTISIVGRYLDDFVLHDGTWKFQRRQVEFVGR
ncbi:MAG: nuclear transport factor 2 family protein [Acidimicrobiales bacterium]